MQDLQQDESGFTLIEILLAVAILGIVFVGMLGALGTVIIGADVHRNQADANAVLISAAEKLKDPAVTYQPVAPPCTVPATYLTAARSATIPSGWSSAQITIDKISFWNGSAFTADCSNDDTPVLRLQLIELSVAGLHGRADETLAVVKRGN